MTSTTNDCPVAPSGFGVGKGAVWHIRSAEAVLAPLGSTPSGLSLDEAACGLNELREAKPIRLFKIFLGQFKSLIIWILIAAGVISGVQGESVDAIAILAVVVLDAVVGFYQEFNAEKTIAALKKLTAPQAKVRRDGKVSSIPATGTSPVTTSNSRQATSWLLMLVFSKPLRSN